MNSDEKAARAAVALSDEIVTLAMTETLDRFNREMLAATTPEDMWAAKMKYEGLKEAWRTLKLWPFFKTPEEK